MKSKRKRKQKPLFYISQPNIETSKPYMQESFLSKNNELDDLSLENEQSETIKVAEEEAPEELEVEEAAEPGVSETELSETTPDIKKRHFNELTLEEKLKHLKLVPASVAKVRYEFITIDKSYKGYFLAIKDGVVSIHSVNTRKKSVNILVEDLVDIKRIGL
jgi:hypothetical protein